MFIRFDTTHERDTHTHTHTYTHTHTDTTWRDRPRLCIAWRGKNVHRGKRRGRFYQSTSRPKGTNRIYLYARAGTGSRSTGSHGQ